MNHHALDPFRAITSVPSRDSDHTTIALFSDTHYWPAGDNFVSSENNLQRLAQTPAILAALCDTLVQTAPDAAIHLGDFTCGGGTYAMTESEFTQALTTVTNTLHRLPFPTFALPGNHDCPPGGGDWSIFERLWNLEHGHGVTIDTDFARLILVNAQGHSSAQIEAAKPTDPVWGWVNKAELARIDHALATADGRPVLVFLHQLLQPWVSQRKWKHYFGVRNRRALIDALGRYDNVAAIFQGHAHMLDIQQAPLGHRDACFVVIPSLIECPIAWLQLDIAPTFVHLRLQTLPVAQPPADLCAGNDVQTWRLGNPAWHDIKIPLHGHQTQRMDLASRPPLSQS